MVKYVTLGDPHLGRKFKTGVPLHRVGEREQIQWNEFEDRLYGHKAQFHVCMGDLFDKFNVPYEIVLRAADIYVRAAQKQRFCQFIILRGNHDVSRDTSKRSAFDVFKALTGLEPNIMVIENVTEIEGMGFVPYDAFQPVSEQVSQLSNGLEVVFMHHDFTDFGGDHVIPTKALADKNINHVIDGHDHIARIEKSHGVIVEIVGSMQPYTHGEDKTGEWYITTSLPIEEDVTNKNVRVLLKPGETLPTDLDCLSLTAKRVTDDDDKIEVDTSDFENLDLKDLLASALDGLSCKDLLMEKFHDNSSVSG